MVDKNPTKFYNDVFNADVTKHSVIRKEDDNAAASDESPSKKRSKSILGVKSKVTKRPYLIMMEKITAKL